MQPRKGRKVKQFWKSQEWIGFQVQIEKWLPDKRGICYYIMSGRSRNWDFWSGAENGGITLDMLQERGPLPGPETSFLTLGNKLSEETRVLTKQEILLRKSTQVESRKTQENNSATWLTVLGFMMMGLVSSLSLAHHSNSESFLVVQLRWMPVRRILGAGRTCVVSYWPFPNSSSWWWLISYVFLTRISCHKTARANGYYGAWTGWEVSVCFP